MFTHLPNQGEPDSEYAPEMGSTEADWQALRDVLRSHSPNADAVLAALVRVWPDDVQTALTTAKLHRWEKPRWASPILSFDIERHGATVHGSKRAEVHTWSVDVDAETVDLVAIRTRQVQKNDARLDVNALAAEVVAVIALGPDGPAVPWLKWSSDGGVEVVTKNLIPMTNQQTTSSRRKRFGACFRTLIEGEGWECRKGVWYPPDASATATGWLRPATD